MKKTTLSNNELSFFCQELALLLHSGVGTGDAMALLAAEDSSRRELFSGLAGQIDDGQALAAALQASGQFPEYLCGLVEVGERSGRTEEALLALARHYEERDRLDQQVRSALLYPAILLVIMLAVIGVLLVKVLPVFNEVYGYLGGSLSGIAGGLLALGQALDAAMPVLCVLLALVVLGLLLFAALPNFRARLTGGWQKHMGGKGVSGKLNAARFAQALSMGLSSGLSLEEAISLAGSLLAGVPAAKAKADKCLALLEEGASLAEAMRQTEILPQAECRLLELALRSGAGDTAMEGIARRLTDESEQALSELVGRVEPALVMITSVLVGLILLAVMLPLMNIMTAIG